MKPNECRFQANHCEVASWELARRTADNHANGKTTAKLWLGDLCDQTDTDSYATSHFTLDQKLCPQLVIDDEVCSSKIQRRGIKPGKVRVAT